MGSNPWTDDQNIEGPSEGPPELAEDSPIVDSLADSPAEIPPPLPAEAIPPPLPEAEPTAEALEPETEAEPDEEPPVDHVAPLRESNDEHFKAYCTKVAQLQADYADLSGVRREVETTWRDLATPLMSQLQELNASEETPLPSLNALERLLTKSLDPRFQIPNEEVNLDIHPIDPNRWLEEDPELLDSQSRGERWQAIEKLQRAVSQLESGIPRFLEAQVAPCIEAATRILSNSSVPPEHGATTLLMKVATATATPELRLDQSHLQAGDPFDPNTQQSLGSSPDPDLPPGTLKQVFSQTFRYRLPNDQFRILRYAQVEVVAETEEAEPETHAE